MLKARMNVNGTEWLVDMYWNNLEKDQIIFGVALKTRQKKTC